MTAADAPAAKKVKTSDFGTETVLFDGFDGKQNEYCPYTETSKNYDGTRAPLGINIVLGSIALSAKPMKEQRLLDIGCGTGTFLKEIEDKVGFTAGVEYNNGMIGEARKLLGYEESRLVQGSADSLPFSDASFDICTMNQVIHHFPQADNYAFNLKAFQEVQRVLKPGGVFILNTSMPDQQRDSFWWLSLFPRASEAVCTRFPPMATLMEHYKAAELQIDADSVVVPLHRSLMVADKYLQHGVKAGFMPEYRAGDSSWSMAENFGELEEGLKKLQTMIDNGKAEEWLEGREMLRKAKGQATFITARKPL